MKTLTGILLFISLSAFAQERSTDQDRRELQDLLTVRKEKFDAYAQSLERRSGIFGGKTKGDLKASQSVLIDIVETDNKIIRSLNRVVDFRNYEKVNMNYDLSERDKRLDGLMQSVDTLSKRADMLTAQNSLLERQVTIRTIFIYILVAAALFLFYLSRKR
jgi:hypothetical protein